MLHFILTAGQRGDSPQGLRLLVNFEKSDVENIVADGACDSDKMRKRSKQLGAKACIKPHPNRKVKKRYDKTIYRNRN